MRLPSAGSLTRLPCIYTRCRRFLTISPTYTSIILKQTGSIIMKQTGSDWSLRSMLLLDQENMDLDGGLLGTNSGATPQFLPTLGAVI